ncbi:MAG: hypothetical protein ACI86S_000949, partial [Paracoccaceae bacterium]
KTTDTKDLYHVMFQSCLFLDQLSRKPIKQQIRRITSGSKLPFAAMTSNGGYGPIWTILT